MEPSASAQPLSFAAQMEIEEQRYAALMAQAKSSLARMKEIGEGFSKVRETHDAREGEYSTRTKDLLSRIKAEAEAKAGEEMEISQEGIKLEEEDYTMGGNEQMDREDHMEEDARMEGNVEMGMATDDPSSHSPPSTRGFNKPGDSNFSELMERAKKLLAGISMDGDGQAVPEGLEMSGAKETWTEEESDAFWNSM